MSASTSNQPAALPARLTWKAVDGTPLERLLDKERVVIGREADCAICINDRYFSRHHAQITYDGNAFVVTDLGSTNGTYLNKVKLGGPQALQDGDTVSIRDIEFHFSKPEPPPPPIEEPKPEKTLVNLAPAVTPHLELCSGASKNVHFDLIKEKMTIGRGGRGQQWDILLADRAVSRPQAEISCQAGEYVLTDLGSANGTLVNGVEITAPQTLKEGDAITLGETVLLFHTGAAGS